MARTTPAGRRSGPVQRPGLAQIRQTLAHRGFALYTAGHAVSLIGSWAQRFAVAWLAWDLTQSSAWLGLVAAALFLPSLALGPIGGAVADRFDRVATLWVTQMLALAQAATLAALALTGLLTIELLLALVLFLGIVTPFSQPAMKALVPSLVGPADLASAIGVNAVVSHVARFLGPALAGTVIATVGAWGVFVLNAASFAAMLAVLLMLRRQGGEPNRAPRVPDGRGLLHDAAEGLRIAVRDPVLRPALALHFLYALLARPLIELFPALAVEIHRLGVQEVALLTAVMGLGATLAGLALATRQPPQSFAPTVVGSLVLLAVSIAGFVCASGLPALVAAMTAYGAAQVSLGVATQSMVQLRSAAEMRGRVIGLYMLLFRVGAAVGALGFGAAGAAIGLAPVFLGAALALGVTAAVGGMLRHRLRMT